MDEMTNDQPVPILGERGVTSRPRRTAPQPVDTWDDFDNEEFAIEYYLLDKQRLARLRRARDGKERFDGEALDENGRWRPCGVDVILSGGRPITVKKARRWARRCGGQL